MSGFETPVMMTMAAGIAKDAPVLLFKKRGWSKDCIGFTKRRYILNASVAISIKVTCKIFADVSHKSEPKMWGKN